ERADLIGELANRDATFRIGCDVGLHLPLLGAFVHVEDGVVDRAILALGLDDHGLLATVAGRPDAALRLRRCLCGGGSRRCGRGSVHYGGLLCLGLPAHPGIRDGRVTTGRRNNLPISDWIFAGDGSRAKARTRGRFYASTVCSLLPEDTAGGFSLGAVEAGGHHGGTASARTGLGDEFRPWIGSPASVLIERVGDGRDLGAVS